MKIETGNLPHIPYEERLLTVEETAEFLKSSINTLNKLRSLGKNPPYYKFGRSVRYKVRDLLEYVEKHRRAFPEARQADASSLEQRSTTSP